MTYKSSWKKTNHSVPTEEIKRRSRQTLLPSCSMTAVLHHGEQRPPATPPVLSTLTLSVYLPPGKKKKKRHFQNLTQTCVFLMSRYQEQATSLLCHYRHNWFIARRIAAIFVRVYYTFFECEYLLVVGATFLGRGWHLLIRRNDTFWEVVTPLERWWHFLKGGDVFWNVVTLVWRVSLFGEAGHPQGGGVGLGAVIGWSWSINFYNNSMNRVCVICISSLSPLPYTNRERETASERLRQTDRRRESLQQ